MGPAPDQLTCVLADDHDGVRGAVRAQLERLDWLEVLAEAPDGASAVELIDELRPDVAIVDVRMPSNTGFDVCSSLVAREVPTKVMLYSALAESSSIEEGLRRGACAVVAKQDGFSALRVELEAVRQGRCGERS